MHASIIPLLARLRQDISDILKPEAIREACRQAGYSWRNRKLDPVATVSLFSWKSQSATSPGRERHHAW